MRARPWQLGISIALGSGSAAAAPIQSTSGDVNGTPTQAITWTDGHGTPRTVHVRSDNHRIVRYTYSVDGSEVTDDEVPNYGIGNLVSHGGCGAITSWDGTPEYQAEAALAGEHHYIWRSTFRLPMCDHPDVSWRVTNEYVFFTGHDGFIQTVTYDSSDLPADQPMGDDMRGPYNQTTWPGDGVISGFGWGSEFRFVTTGPIPDGDANVGGGVAVPWTWTEPNTIPYVWEWADPAMGGAVDREYGMVQNQPYVEQDFGGGFYGCGGDCFASGPPLSGSALPASWAMPTQLSAYDSNYRSGRITWGGIYGAFENGHANDTGTIGNMGDHFRPINAWSWTHVVGKFSEGGLTARVADTENAYGTTMTATTGTVITSGPRGPGDFIGPTVGRMPTIDWSNPGLDFIYRAWNVAAADGAVAVTLDVAGSLEHPVFVVHDFPAEEEVVRIDGADAVADTDYYASYDAATGRLWVTVAATLDAGSHTLVVGPSGVDLPPDTGGVDDSGGDDGGPGGEGGDGGDDDGTVGGGDDGSGPGGGTADDGGSQDDDDAGGCGCRQHGSTPAGLFALAVFGALSRRRRRAR